MGNRGEAKPHVKNYGMVKPMQKICPADQCSALYANTGLSSAGLTAPS